MIRYRSSRPPETELHGGASLDADQARRQCPEESNDIVAAQPAAAHNRAGTVDPVDLEDMLGNIQPNVW